MITVHGMKASGNCYKVQLLLEQLGLEYRWVEVDILNGQNRHADFLARNPSGEVPVLELEDGRCLVESDAILCYLADGTPLLPADRWLRAQALRWMFFEQYSHEPCIAVSRFICRFLPPDHPRREELPRLHVRGLRALSLMDKHLQRQPFFVESGYSVADIALYAYTHDAPAAGFDLGHFPAVQAWLQRVEAQPGFVAQSF
jgi:glutathione S-transferase